MSMRFPELVVSSLFVLAAVGCNSGGSSGSADSCAGVVNQPGPLLDLPWPAASNTGHDLAPGGTVHFHWSGSHNVLSVATFTGQQAPLSPFADAGWPLEVRSGDPQADGSFDWNVGSSPCGYRPGIHFFVDEGNPAAGVTAVGVTDTDASHFAPRPASSLADGAVFGGRYGQYASRAGATLYEVNNFQTAAHFDWVQPIFTAKQGDLILFRWSGLHNVVQVHDVTQDTAMAGGLNSGAKSNCVPGAHYSCANGGPSLASFSSTLPAIGPASSTSRTSLR